MEDVQKESLSAPLTNLPILLTSFVGRDRETKEVLRLLEEVRLLTLTGPPGCGKTRLALEAGRSLFDRYTDGVWLVDLAQTADPAVVPRLTVQALELVPQGENHLEAALLRFLRGKKLLILFDNCEHLVEEAARLCLSMLSAGPGVQILATSQVPLGIPGEQEWLIPSLPLPDPDDTLSDLPSLAQFDAVRLFVERAESVLPGFRLTSENAAGVAQICRRLDGIPLAIELAAARVKILSVGEIEARLDGCLDLLAAPRLRGSGRHQTLQAAIDWSFHLLTNKEQALLCRLAVFHGSFSLEAAETVCGFDPLDPALLVQGLGELVDRSLVMVRRSEGQETRYRLLDSIRLYGLARLSQEEQAGLRDRHLAYFTSMAAKSDQESRGPRLIEWMNRLDADLANIRAVFNWVFSNPEPDRVLKGLRAAGCIAWYMRLRNMFDEAVSWLEGFLEKAKGKDEPDWLAARAHAHYGLIWMYWIKDYTKVRDHIEKSRELWSKLGVRGRSGYAYATIWKVNIAFKQNDLSDGELLIPACREIFEAEKDTYGLCFVLLLEGDQALKTNNLPQAEKQYLHLKTLSEQAEFLFFLSVSYGRLFELYQKAQRYEEALENLQKSLELSKMFQSPSAVVLDMIGMSEIHLALGNLEEAETLMDQALVIQEKTTAQGNKAFIYRNCGEINLLKRDDRAARSMFLTSARIFHERRYFLGIVSSCYGLAATAAEENPAWAAKVSGYARQTAGNHETGMFNEHSNAIVADRLAMARSLIGDVAFDRAVAEGAACAFEDLIPPDNTLPAPAQSLPKVTPRKLEKARYSGLTARERQIAARIAQGLSNPAIAKDLTISERTVTTHVTNILSKLGFSSRTQIAAWAAEKGLTKSQ